MEELVQRSLRLAGDLILPLAIGYILQRIRPVPEPIRRRMVDVAIIGLAPILALISIWDTPLSRSALLLPILGASLQLIAGGLALLWIRWKLRARPLDQGAYFLSATLSNRAILGALVVYILLDQQAYAQARLMIAAAPLVLYGICFPAAEAFLYRSDATQEKRPWWAALLSIRQLPVVGLIVGIGLNLGNVAPIEGADTAFAWIMHAFAWLAILPVGMELKFRQIFRFPSATASIAVIKFIISPALGISAALLLGMTPRETTVVGIVAAAPTAILAVVTATLYRLNVEMAQSAFLFTTGLYLIVVFPLLAWLL